MGKRYIDRPELIAAVREQTKRLLKLSDAHIVITVIKGFDGTYVDCSSRLSEEDTQIMVKGTAKGAYDAAAFVNQKGLN